MKMSKNLFLFFGFLTLEKVNFRFKIYCTTTPTNGFKRIVLNRLFSFNFWQNGSYIFCGCNFFENEKEKIPQTGKYHGSKIRGVNNFFTSQPLAFFTIMATMTYVNLFVIKIIIPYDKAKKDY